MSSNDTNQRSFIYEEVVHRTVTSYPVLSSLDHPRLIAIGCVVGPSTYHRKGDSDQTFVTFGVRAVSGPARVQQRASTASGEGSTDAPRFPSYTKMVSADAWMWSALNIKSSNAVIQVSVARWLALAFHAGRLHIA